MAPESKKGAVYTPAPPPPLPAGVERPTENLAEKQEAMLNALLERFGSADYKLPGDTASELTETEKFWLTRECLQRFLRAVKWSSVKDAIERVEGTLKWRREFGVWDLSANELKIESVTGKEIIYGYDTDRRPVLYLMPSRQNTEESHRQIEFVVWMLERTLDLAGPGVETLSLMINYSDRAKNPSFSTSRTVLNILQTHYPERLGRAMILNVPWLLNAFFKLITPLIDPRTREKMKFNPKPIEDGLFTADQLFAEGGWKGGVDFQWDHDQYWPALLQLCAELREVQLKRWRELGGRVGLSEWDIKQASAAIVPPSKAVDAPAPTTVEATPPMPTPAGEQETAMNPTVAETAADKANVPESVAAVPEAAGVA
ncbi:CRAL/TRIO domain-containing protein [Peniophora sp. CONT]|nr:CRAL/TRIO domain-containing protein [Peniophora sp. CONT]